MAPKSEKSPKKAPKLKKINFFCIKSGFCNEPKIANICHCASRTQIAGVTIIEDAEGFGLNQLRHFTIENAKNMTSFTQDSFPLWFRSIHIVNAPRLFYLAYNVVKPFLNERVKNNLFFHSSLESLHEHVPKDILPEELGGDMGPYDNQHCVQAVFSIEKHFAKMQQYVAAYKEVESK